MPCDEETVDSLPVSRFGESTPGTGCIEQLGNSDRPEDGLQSLLTHAVRSHRVQGLRTDGLFNCIVCAADHVKLVDWSVIVG